MRIAGCYLKREGASHSLWINPKTGVVEAVPRHTEAGYDEVLSGIVRRSGIQIGAAVLDLGTGTGSLAGGLAHLGAQVWGVDLPA